MGRKQTHKKDLRSEKAKIKLKTKCTKTKFLPKGTNVTDLNFKVAPIVIREQLRAVLDAESLERKQQSYKDLLIRLNHHNLSAKCDALTGLIEWVSYSSCEVVELHLSELLRGAFKLVLDIEFKVREKTTKLLSLIFEKVSSQEKLMPFFNILTSYITCAMTHIKKSVQEDSILVFDLYLQYTPMIVFVNFDKLLDSFLSLISKLRFETKQTRTLSDNLESSLTSIKWRIKVLRRLQLFLKVYINECNKHLTGSFSKCITVNDEMVGHYIPLSTEFSGSYTNFLDDFNLNSSKDKLQYVDLLIPLLYETWAEVAPLSNSTHKDNGFTVIKLDAASVLSCITDIYCLLWKLANTENNKTNGEIMKVFLSKHNRKFINHLLKQFPFRQNHVRRHDFIKDMKLLELNLDIKCINENLLIAYVFATLYKKFSGQMYQKKAQEILDYLEICLTHRNYLSPRNFEILCLVLQTVFFENGKSWSQRQIKVEELLDNVVQFYDSLSEENSGKYRVFNLLCDIVELPHLRSETYQEWLCMLPLLLCKPRISASTINTLSLLTRQIDKGFLLSFKDNLPQILDNLMAIEITDTGEDIYPLHLKIASMIRYLPLEKQDKMYIHRFVQQNEDSLLTSLLSTIL